jgi:hypothetical protein
MRTTGTLDPNVVQLLLKEEMPRSGATFRQAVNQAIRRAPADSAFRLGKPFKLKPRRLSLCPGTDPAMLGGGTEFGCRFRGGNFGACAIGAMRIRDDRVPDGSCVAETYRRPQPMFSRDLRKDESGWLGVAIIANFCRQFVVLSCQRVCFRLKTCGKLGNLLEIGLFPVNTVSSHEEASQEQPSLHRPLE